MNELTKFLVESVIGTEFDKPKTSVALFGGGFKPPTKGHLEVVNTGLKNNPEVSEIKILVGGGTRNGFTQDQAVKIWNLYNDIGFIKKPATIIPVSSPFTYYKEYLKDNPDDQVYVFIGSRLNDEGDQKDVKQRSEFVKKYGPKFLKGLKYGYEGLKYGLGFGIIGGIIAGAVYELFQIGKNH